MSFIELTRKHHVGVKMIDDQHVKLADMINYLNDAIDTGADNEEAKILLNAIIGFAEYHFNEEEGYMRRVGCRDFNIHAEEHRKMKDRLTETRDKLDQEEAKLPDTLASYLKNWLVNHIQQMDSTITKIKSKATV